MRLLINARNRSIAVEGGRIVATEGRFDLALDFPEAEVRPGLINGHDHLHRNHYGRLGRPPYANAYDWARDIQARCSRRIGDGRAWPRRRALLAGAWKNLFSGVTSVVHHDRWEPDFDEAFPIRVIPVRSTDSLGMTPTLDAISGDGPFCLHLAEGIDAGAAGEVAVLAERGLLTRDLIAVHGLGMHAPGITAFRASGAALVWCPSSNLFLFRRTAPSELLSEGVDVLLGSDSRLTAAGDLLDELRCARRLGLIEDRRLEDAVGAAPTRRLGWPTPSLEPGAIADLVVLAKPLLEASADDVALVLVGGEPRVARPELAVRLEPSVGRGEPMRIGSVTRWTRGSAAPEPVGSSFP